MRVSKYFFKSTADIKRLTNENKNIFHLNSSSKPDTIASRPLSHNTSQSNSSLIQQHSRNSCKKLKCPKCNWHYKYRETLDIHMREKHSESVLKCIYCLEHTQHPRLGRGEQYKCGYKPYRCETCDYSTTTKGNLSIHMQSDKHLNNVKEGKTNTDSLYSTKTPLFINESSLSESKEPFPNSEGTHVVRVCYLKVENSFFFRICFRCFKNIQYNWRTNEKCQFQFETE
jgi:hypothetical protein